MSILATMPPKASSASSPCSAAPALRRSVACSSGSVDGSHGSTIPGSTLPVRYDSASTAHRALPGDPLVRPEPMLDVPRTTPMTWPLPARDEVRSPRLGRGCNDPEQVLRQPSTRTAQERVRSTCLVDEVAQVSYPRPRHTPLMLTQQHRAATLARGMEHRASSVAVVLAPPRPQNTGDKLRSGARVRPGRRGHSAAPPAERRLRREGWCRRKPRQLHPLVRLPRRAGVDPVPQVVAVGSAALKTT
jgi:hypothetical protein